MHELLELDSLAIRKPGVWPWVIGFTALITLALTVTRNLESIPKSIEASVLSLLGAANVNGVSVTVDGRDVTLTGTLTSGDDRNGLVRNIQRLNGVRVVIDELQLFNPREQSSINRIRFEQALTDIDTSAVTFEPNRATLSLSSESTLLRIAQLLKSNPQRQIKIAGHTDNTGNTARNLELSRERAQAVADFLIDRGISDNQIIVQGYGETQPLYSNATEEGRAGNRRIELNLMN